MGQGHKGEGELDVDAEVFEIVRGIVKRNLDCSWKVQPLSLRKVE